MFHMKQNLPLILLCLMAVMQTYAGTTYLHENFSEGIPDSFVLVDADSNEPSVDAKKMGFQIGKPWIQMTDEQNGNSFAASTSWYKKAGTSSDWMILPAITPASDKLQLSWRAMASDATYRDGYSVYVSTNGSQPESFDTDKPVFSIAKEAKDWTFHTVTLEGCSGQEVYIAFVNNSTDCCCLYVDDICVEDKSGFDFTHNIGRVITHSAGGFHAQGSITVSDNANVGAFKVSVRIGQETAEQNFDANILPGESYDFTLSYPLNPKCNETSDYEITVTADNESKSYSGITVCYPHNIVCEEITGTWCGYCVGGIVSMREMREKYPDNFIGIAVHGSGSRPDPMAMEEYTASLIQAFNMTGYPNCVVNRRIDLKGNPTNLSDYFNRIYNRIPEAGVVLTSVYDADTREINAEASINFSKSYDNADFRMVYLLIENDVHSEDFEYSQTNYYSGGGNGKMGGFENKPNPVPAGDMWYDDVARYISEFSGEKNSIPSEISDGETVNHACNITIPENVTDVKNTEIVAVLLNGSNGEVVNAAKIPVVTDDSAVNNIQEDTHGLEIKDGKLIAASDSAMITVYNTAGAVCAAGQGSVSCKGLKGVYIVTVLNDRVLKNYKTIF